MTNKTYTPAPIDTSCIKLSEELINLTEVMAQNVHEVWAQNRISEGWQWGPVRDDAKKETPCLVPYDLLPDIEKAYDRNTAIQTLKLILSLGYTIKKEYP